MLLTMFFFFFFLNVQIMIKIIFYLEGLYFENGVNIFWKCI